MPGTALSISDPWTDRGHVILELAGESGPVDAPMLREALQRLPGGPPLRLVLDLRALAFLDGACVGVLLGVLRRARNSGGDVALVGATGLVEAKLRGMGLTRLFGMHASLEGAFAWLDGRVSQDPAPQQAAAG